MNEREKYGLSWDESFTDLQIELYCISKGGQWEEEGVTLGFGNSHHYEQARRLIWPELDSHRWWIICRDEILKNKITVLMGPGSSGKTHNAACIYLIEYWAFPHELCLLVSSTDMRSLRLRIWGELTMLWQTGKDRFPFLAGHLLDSKLAITTDVLIDDGDWENRRVRDLRKGLIGIPTVQGGRSVGLGKWVGIKQQRVRLIADEASLMSDNFLSAFANLNKNSDFRAIVCGNPSDILDPLGKAAEPLDGWSSHMEPEKTSVWKTRFLNGTCVNLIGTDSPNFDFPQSEPTRYKYLISREKIADTTSFFSKDSVEYFSQCVGAMKVGTMARRVITRDLCIKFHALEDAVWKGTNRTKVAGLDAAFGGDRAMLGDAEFGEDTNGKIVIKFNPLVIVPISVRENTIPEDQIADYVKNFCQERSIPPENFFHDSTGRGSLGTALARIWSAACNPVEFGGAPSERPVSLDLYVWDPVLRAKRLKTCKEHYSKRVSEFWFSVRYSIESEQIRNLPSDAMEEFCMREWERVRDDKIEIEKKTDMKDRIGRSPDCADCVSIIVEGARRRGFQISKLANHESKNDSMKWLVEMKQKRDKLTQSKQLSYRR